MAHNVETMAYSGEVPWHGLGTKVSNDIGIDDMLKEAGLDWKVIPVPVFGELNGKKISSDYQMLVRNSDRKVLTMITDSWNPVQNLEAFELGYFGLSNVILDDNSSDGILIIPIEINNNKFAKLFL